MRVLLDADGRLLTPSFCVCSANQDPIFSSYKLPDGNEPGERHFNLEKSNDLGWTMVVHGLHRHEA